MALKLDFSAAENKRVELTEEQQRKVRRLYKNVNKDINERLKQIPQTASGTIQQFYLKELQKQVKEQLAKINSELQGTIEGNMHSAADAVVQDNLDFLQAIGMPVQGAFSNVPDAVVRSVATGQLYKGNWSLSGAIWKNTAKAQQDINTVVAKGIAENKSSFDIAKDLEKYVNPDARKDWEWGKVYPGTNKVVDYSAQRLARTMVSHAYQQAFEVTTKPNPFVTKYQWLSSGGPRMCDICDERDRQYFEKDDLPLDHPNGMCTFIAVIEDSMIDISNRLADWAQGKPDPELDEYSAYLYGAELQNIFTEEQEEWLTPYGYSPDSMPTDFTEWAKTIPHKKLSDFLHSIGGDWTLAHPYQYMEAYYNKNLAPVKQGVKAVKETTLKNAGKGKLKIPNVKEWIEKVKNNRNVYNVNEEHKALSLLTKAEKAGVVKYTGNAYDSMNTYMRKVAGGVSESTARRGISDANYRALENAKQGLSKTRLENDMILRRGTDLGDLVGLMGTPYNEFNYEKEKLERMSIDELKDSFVGLVGKYSGFTSTSWDYDGGFYRDVEMIFYAPKGTEAAGVTSISEHPTENELLLNAGTTVRIVDVKESDGHMWSKVQVFAEIIPEIP